MQPQADYTLQNAIYNVLAEHPDWRGNLQEMVKDEIEGAKKEYYLGWESEDVHTPPWVIKSLLYSGIVDQAGKSRAYHHYHLHSLADTQAALDSGELGARSHEPIEVDSLFDLVVGHEKAKTILRMALKATSAVHVLLKGPPGTAKTLFLSDIARLPGGEYYVGTSTTKSGILGLLLQVKPRILVIDELDKMSSTDQSALLTLMETGMVTRLMHGIQERVQMETRVFAGANLDKYIQDPLLSRFAKLDIPPYTAEQFVNVAQAVLMKRQGCGPEMALLIARQVVVHSRDIRDAVRVARMADNDARKVMLICSCLWSQGPAKITALPQEG